MHTTCSILCIICVHPSASYTHNRYMDNFDYPTKNQLLFEKSATYFTHPFAPYRAAQLLPEAKIIIILHDPVIRAYSWYQVNNIQNAFSSSHVSKPFLSQVLNFWLALEFDQLIYYEEITTS